MKVEIEGNYINVSDPSNLEAKVYRGLYCLTLKDEVIEVWGDKGSAKLGNINIDKSIKEHKIVLC